MTPGELAVCRASEAWREDLVDPAAAMGDDWSRRRISEFIHLGLGWTWERYVKDGDFEWCGAFLAWAYSFAGGLPFLNGYRLRADVRETFCASTIRLDTLGRNEPWIGATRKYPPSAQRHYVQFDEHSTPAANLDVRPGDVLLVGAVPGAHPRARAYGQHVTVVESYAGGVFTTIEGNARGPGPRGDVRQGVIRTTRPIGLAPGQPRTHFHARRLIRFAPEDFA